MSGIDDVDDYSASSTYYQQPQPHVTNTLLYNPNPFSDRSHLQFPQQTTTTSFSSSYQCSDTGGHINCRHVKKDANTDVYVGQEIAQSYLFGKLSRKLAALKNQGKVKDPSLEISKVIQKRDDPPQFVVVFNDGDEGNLGGPKDKSFKNVVSTFKQLVIGKQ